MIRKESAHEQTSSDQITYSIEKPGTNRRRESLGPSERDLRLACPSAAAQAMPAPVSQAQMHQQAPESKVSSGAVCQCPIVLPAMPMQLQWHADTDIIGKRVWTTPQNTPTM